MNRSTFMRLADVRLREAHALMAARQWSGAYYLAGYAIECGLKAKVVTQFKKWELPDKTRVQRVYTHKLDDLVKLAGLDLELADARRVDTFDVHWGITKDWSEASRYATWNRAEAAQLVNAVSDPSEGVLPWLRRHW